MSISKSKRFRVLRRDSFRCRYCGRGAKHGVELQMDHLAPRAADGSDSEFNLVTACADCNAGKSAEQLSEADRLWMMFESAQMGGHKEAAEAIHRQALEAQREEPQEPSWFCQECGSLSIPPTPTSRTAP